MTCPTRAPSASARSWSCCSRSPSARRRLPTRASWPASPSPPADGWHGRSLGLRSRRPSRSPSGGGLAAGSDAVAALFALLATAIAGEEARGPPGGGGAAAATAALGVAAAISDSGALLALAVVIAPAGLVTGLARRQYVLRVEQASCVSRTRRLAGRAEDSARPAGTRVVVADDQTAVRSRLRVPPVRPAGRAGRARRGTSRAVPVRLR